MKKRRSARDKYKAKAEQKLLKEILKAMKRFEAAMREKGFKKNGSQLLQEEIKSEQLGIN